VRVGAGAFLFAVLLLAGCGGSSSGDGGGSSAETLDQLAAGGKQLGITPGTSDLAPGPVRFTFLILDSHGRAIERPTAGVWIAKTREDVPFVRTTARFVPAGVAGHTHEDEDGQSGHVEAGEGVYVVNTRLDRPGTYWLLARPAGAKVQALGNILVKPETESPALGAKAPVSDTPTLGDAPIALLTTQKPPDRALLRHSVADSLAAHKPFVVTFATPAFCSSRVCGPVVDVVDDVRRDFAGKDVRFIHVEIYKDNDQSKGINRWVRQWKLPTEPWTFLVGGDGRIKAKYEGVVSVGELRQAVQSKLLR
jgi:hypothetical protein